MEYSRAWIRALSQAQRQARMVYKLHHSGLPLKPQTAPGKRIKIGHIALGRIINYVVITFQVDFFINLATSAEPARADAIRPYKRNLKNKVSDNEDEIWPKQLKQKQKLIVSQLTVAIADKQFTGIQTGLCNKLVWALWLSPLFHRPVGFLLLILSQTINCSLRQLCPI